ncbi:DoxX family protein [Planctomicrobium sp. SH664]|uniref:DoxX family protein n=1 Tax=Planctomicrobium sp. SH664 TaxID=3448125 RepID=UPI003F5AFE67
MSLEAPAPSPKWMIWTGRVLSTLVVLLLLMSAVMKLARAQPVLEGMPKMGYPVELAVPLGVVELVCTLLYVFPWTRTLGAILLTGYLGGATATHLRVSEPFIGPVMIGVVTWLGLFLRDSRLRVLLPFQK